MPVNPKHRSILGVLTFDTISSLLLIPDLAVVATPSETVPGLIAELGVKGTKAAVVITAGSEQSSTEDDPSIVHVSLDLRT